MEVYVELLEIVVCFLLFLQKGTSVYSQASSQSPMFQGSTVNVTAEAGKTAILPCIVNFVGEHKVAWMDPRQKVLSVGDQRVIHDLRMTIERPVKQEWNLHIRSVRPTDAGEYRCQINMSPIKSKKITLTVSEPPVIVLDSGNKEVIEGSTVLLWCKAKGNPEPTITWYRTNMHSTAKPEEVIDKEGEQLKITNVSRYCEDEYKCVASNGIGDDASRTMKVTVQFPPEVDIPSKRMVQSRGLETMLDCKIQANPFGIIVWKKNGKELSNNGKYGVDIFEDGLYKKTLSLRINNLEENDFGQYRCYSTNELGDDHGDMYLGELIRVHPPETTTTTLGTLVWSGTRVPFIPYPEDPINEVDDPVYRQGPSRSTSGVDNPYSNSALVFVTLSLALILGFLDRR